MDLQTIPNFRTCHKTKAVSSTISTNSSIKLGRNLPSCQLLVYLTSRNCTRILRQSDTDFNVSRYYNNCYKCNACNTICSYSQSHAYTSLGCDSANPFATSIYTLESTPPKWTNGRARQRDVKIIQYPRHT